MKHGQHRRVDYTGQVFGFLAAEEDAGTTGKKRRWLFRCRCGNTVIRLPVEVRKSLTKGCVPSCGCQLGKVLQTHGMTRHPVYAVWRSMNDRCRLPTHQAWKNYGGRGITVCPEWQESFEAFWADMGPTYVPGLTLEWKNNDAGYSPQNCKWATYAEQVKNRRPMKRRSTTSSTAAPAIGS